MTSNQLPPAFEMRMTLDGKDVVYRYYMEDQIKDYLTAMESFCTGLQGVNDELRARIVKVEDHAEQWEITATNLLDRAERAEKERDELKRKYGGKTNA